MEMNIKEEMNKMNDDVKMEDMKPITPVNRFVEFGYSSGDAFKRFETIKKANESIRKSVYETGGNMPAELIMHYESLNSTMEAIKLAELDIISVGV